MSITCDQHMFGYWPYTTDGHGGLATNGRSSRDKHGVSREASGTLQPRLAQDGGRKALPGAHAPVGSGPCPPLTPARERLRPTSSR